MAGLVPPARAEALWSDLSGIASAGEGPAIHVLDLVWLKFVDARHKAGHDASKRGPRSHFRSSVFVSLIAFWPPRITVTAPV
jgi:hypothetical protein